MTQVMMPMTHFDQKENSSPHGPVSREKQHTAEAALLSEDRRRVLTAAYNGVSAGEARERLLQNPAVSLGPGLNLPPTEDKTYNLLTHYRIPGPELVNKSVPSCGLPAGWSDKHDRCIAYLSTHAPLVHGKVPPQEKTQSRYTTRQITTFLLKRFPDLCRHRIKESTIELRLELLDRSENSYFSVAYGGYKDFEWGRDI